MMNNRDEVVIKTIIDTIHEIYDYIDNTNCKSFEEYDKNSMLKRATSMCLISISEMMDVLSDEFKKTHNEIEFSKLKKLRNIAAHKYGAINFRIVWEIIQKNLPVFRDKFKRALDKEKGKDFTI